MLGYERSTTRRSRSLGRAIRASPRSNFATSSSQLYYNGVTAGTNSNTLKAMEANWITTVKRYCPWSAKVLSVDDRRAGAAADVGEEVKRQQKMIAIPLSTTIEAQQICAVDD